MAEPLTPAETSDEAFARARQAIDATKQTRPRNDAEARARSVELIRQQQTLVDAAKRVAEGRAASRVTTNGGTRPAGGQRTGITAVGTHELARGLMGWLGPELKTINQRLAALEASQLTDGGTWNSDKLFKPNELATFKGAIWICLEPNKNTRPGDRNSCWRLMHKTIGLGR